MQTSPAIFHNDLGNATFEKLQWKWFLFNELIFWRRQTTSKPKHPVTYLNNLNRFFNEKLWFINCGRLWIFPETDTWTNWWQTLTIFITTIAEQISINIHTFNSLMKWIILLSSIGYGIACDTSAFNYIRSSYRLWLYQRVYWRALVHKLIATNRTQLIFVSSNHT